MRLKLTLVILLILLLGVQTGSAWSDHFTSDTSGSYGGDVGSFTWKTGAPGYLNTTIETGLTIAYKDAKFGSGNYTWIEFYDDYDTYHTIRFAADSATDTGYPWGSGNSYQLRNYRAVGAIYTDFRKVVAGSVTSLHAQYCTAAVPGEITYDVSWDQTTGDISVFVDGILCFTHQDATFTADGYMGIGNYDGPLEVNLMSFVSSTPPTTATPTPTPTPTPIPAPIIIAENVTCKIGETWLRCNWTFNDNLTSFVVDDQTIYRNGTLYKQNYSQHYISFTDLNPNSLQIIEIWYKNFTYNNYTMKQYVQLRTHPGSTWWYFALGLLMTGIGYFVPVFGFLSIFLMATGMYMAYDLSSQGYTLLIYSLGFVLSIVITGWRLSR